MTYFDKFLMQGLSKYYKKNYRDFKRFVWRLFKEYSKNILRIFLQKQSQKQLKNR
jgi:hypothetical protein